MKHQLNSRNSSKNYKRKKCMLSSGQFVRNVNITKMRIKWNKWILLRHCRSYNRWLNDYELRCKWDKKMHSYIIVCRKFVTVVWRNSSNNNKIGIIIVNLRWKFVENRRKFYILYYIVLPSTVLSMRLQSYTA